jgi:gliding motility-associated lipoprotein GldH
MKSRLTGVKRKRKTGIPEINMKTFFVFFGIFFFITGCDPFMFYDEYSKTDGGQWKWSDKKSFEVNMIDSLQLYNIYINIRHTTDYPKSNLFVFITATAPSGITRRDTVEIIIADEHGRWEGNGFGDIKLVSREYRRAVRFPLHGKYSFEFEQGMRMPEIPVTDVGLRIEEYRELE